MIPDRERTTGSLFERMEASPARNWQGSSIHALRQSIRQNLRNILNTRSGSCRGAPELGIDEPEGAENFRESMSLAIAQCIERYEPRISHAGSAGCGFIRHQPAGYDVSYYSLGDI